MDTLEKEVAPDRSAPRLPNRLEVLAAIGEAYLVLEAHQAASQQCIQRIQQLRGQLQQLERDLAAAAHEKGASR